WGDHRKFRDIIQRDNITHALVDLSSDGGIAVESLAIGYIKELGFSTRAMTTYTCTSGCAIIWIAGRERYLHGVAETGGGQTSRGPRLGRGWLTRSSFSLSPAPHPRSGPKIPQFPLTTSRAEANPPKRIGLPSPTAYLPASSAHFLFCLIER